MMALSSIRGCFEGAVPSCIATSDLEGTPNVSYVSQVHYLDSQHVALTFQFFNRTHHNINVNPQATVVVTDPDSGAQYRLALLFRETVVEGALFHAIKAKLAGVASNTGMSGVFHLKGVDIYRVLDVELIHSGNPALAAVGQSLLPSMRYISGLVGRCRDMSELFDTVVSAISDQFNTPQVTLLLADEQGQVLYTVANAAGVFGIGAEIPFGVGIIGVCAQEKIAIRIAFGASEYSYHNAIEHYTRYASAPDTLETAIRFPELDEPASQLAVPVLLGSRLIGVIYLESDKKRRFAYDDEDALSVIADLLAARYQLLASEPESNNGSEVVEAEPVVGNPTLVRYYPVNHSIFIDNNYLIKGVAGAILWRILQQFQEEGRREFTNKELRLDGALGLPEVSENLESRLILLQKRLCERCAHIAIEKNGRGRFRLRLKRPIKLLCDT